MRKMLKNKKGFTLVELMIVVVIMAILVAVAIPIYNAVTAGVEKNSCEANARIISDNFSAFQMTGNDGGAFNWNNMTGTYTLKPGATTADASAVTTAETGTGAPTAEQLKTFVGMFKDGLPSCPSDDTKGYVITVQNGTFTVACQGEHNPSAPEE